MRDGVRRSEDAMEVRDTVDGDIERLAALIDGVARERLYLAGTVGFPVESTRAFVAAVRASGGVHLVADLGGEIVGWCDIVPHSFEGMRHCGRLGMGVRKDLRSRGIGRALLDAAIRRAFAGGLERIELEVFASNHGAVEMYRRFGFECEGRKVAGRKLDGVTDDILLWAKRRAA